MKIYVLLASILLGSAAFAHHNGANTYMRGKPVQWQGTVSFVSWDGAHVMYQIDVRNPQGVVESWQVLGGSPYRLAKRGIRKSTVKAGDAITVAGYLDAGARIVTPVYIAQIDGSKLYVGYVSNDSMFTAPTN
jgi:hypothetical protein